MAVVVGVVVALVDLRMTRNRWVVAVPAGRGHRRQAPHRPGSRSSWTASARPSTRSRATLGPSFPSGHTSTAAALWAAVALVAVPLVGPARRWRRSPASRSASRSPSRPAACLLDVHWLTDVIAGPGPRLGLVRRLRRRLRGPDAAARRCVDTRCFAQPARCSRPVTSAQTSAARSETKKAPWREGASDLPSGHPERHSGGGIRTRDLRVMSPTSYLAAPPRGVDGEFYQPTLGPASRDNTSEWPAASSPAGCPATRSTASPRRTTSTSGPSRCRPPPDELRDARRRRRGAAVAAHRPRSTPSCSTPRRELRAIANYAVGTDNIDLEAAARARHPGRQHARRAHRRDRRPRLRAAARRARGACREAAARRARRRVAHVGAERLARPRRRTARRSAIVGFGRIGQAVARRGERLRHEGPPHDAPRTTPLDELLERADFVSLHTPAHARDPPPDRRRRARAR